MVLLYCLMKILMMKKQNLSALREQSKTQVSKPALKQLKGGDDIIIVDVEVLHEDLVITDMIVG